MAAAILLCACAQTPRQNTHHAALTENSAQQLTQWRSKGKMRITSPDVKQNASFDWQQFGNNYTINFFGPFGIGSSWLRKTSKGVTLETPDHPVKWAKSAEQLLAQNVGWNMPVSHLKDWIKGIPTAGTESSPITTTESGNTQFEQAGWLIAASKFKQRGNFQLPGKVVISQNDWKVLIVIKQWEPK